MILIEMFCLPDRRPHLTLRSFGKSSPCSRKSCSPCPQWQSCPPRTPSMVHLQGKGPQLLQKKAGIAQLTTTHIPEIAAPGRVKCPSPRTARRWSPEGLLIHLKEKLGISTLEWFTDTFRSNFEHHLIQSSRMNLCLLISVSSMRSHPLWPNLKPRQLFECTSRRSTRH